MAEKDGSKFAVYMVKKGRTEKGIVRTKKVTIVEDDAFVVHPNGGTADILPAGAIFNTYEEAERYLNGEGIPSWVVYTEKWQQGYNDLPRMCRARVLRHNYRGRYSNESRVSIVGMDGVPLNPYRPYQVQYFKLKKDAEKAFAAAWQQQRKSALGDIAKFNAYLAELEKNKPRSKKKAT